MKNFFIIIWIIFAICPFVYATDTSIHYQVEQADNPSEVQRDEAPVWSEEESIPSDSFNAHNISSDLEDRPPEVPLEKPEEPTPEEPTLGEVQG